MTERLRWGILGTGMIAKKFAGDLPKSNSGTLAAVGSRSIESAAAFTGEFGGRPHGSYDALVADPEIDAVYISLPNGLHKEWSIEVMEAGKHALCEKPIGLNASEAEEMFAAAERTGKTLIEAFMYRAHPQTRALAKAIRDEKAIGDLRLIRANFTFEREASRADARYHPGQGGGSIMDVGCYCVSFARLLAGNEPTKVECFAHMHPFGVDDYAAGVLRFGEDLLMTFTSGMTVGSDSRSFVAGTEGRLEVDSFWFCREPYLINGEKRHVEEPRPLYAVEADAFAAAVAGEEAPFMSKEDSINNMHVLDALRRKAGVPHCGAS